MEQIGTERAGGERRMTQARAAFARRIARDFRNQITGEDRQELVGENPENRFLVGKLLPWDREREEQNTSSVFIETVGMDFYLPAERIRQAEVTVYPRGEFYYRCYPTLEQQRAYLCAQADRTYGRKFASFREYAEAVRAGMRDQPCELVPVYRKCGFGGRDSVLRPAVTFRPWELLERNGGLLRERSYGKESEGGTMRDLLRALEAQAQSDPDYYSFELTERTSCQDLESEEAYRQGFLARWLRGREDRVGQNWKLSVWVTVKEVRDEGAERYLVSVTLMNESQAYRNRKTHASNSQKDDKRSIETLFNAGLDVTLAGASFAPIELRYFRNDYKYDRCQMAVGRNCSVVYDEKARTLSTEHIPTFAQKRLTPRDDPELQVSFEELFRGDPVRRLKGILERMDQEYQRRRRFPEERGLTLTEEGRRQFETELYRFSRERDRFRDGIRLMEELRQVRESFRLMNEAFAMNAEVFHKFRTWRLFQLVYIVSLIPDVAACDPALGEGFRDRLEEVSLLYFPTGGGKTEAFLGVLVFNLFFDRFRGKKYGVTAILRYPLRLLSIQQVQRLANILAQAELLRRREAELRDSDPFALGYFVGSANTPNRVSREAAGRYRKAQREGRLDEERIIDVCPFCGQETVHLRFDEETSRLVHFCAGPGCACPFEDRFLPIYMVDTEIYRYLPSAIISTVDKLAVLGLNPNFRAILSGAAWRCPRHGFTSGSRCLAEGCREPARTFQRFWIRDNAGDPDASSGEGELEFYDPAPSLFIQDELHLIRESLGTYASHYESFLNDFTEYLSPSRRKVKTIGATATISSYEEQVNELYNREAVRFPCECPDLKDLFYARVDESDVQRQIMGCAPFGKAAISSMAYSMKYMRTVVNRYRVHPEDLGRIEGMPERFGEDPAEAQRLLADYWIFLEYNNVKRDGNNVEGMLETPVNVELREEGVPEFVSRQMTGDEDFHTVRELLSRIENTPDEELFRAGALNTIIATSMISHGVDADRFNIMFFFGMPGNTAEYVQAYSRTGRKHPSIVIDLIRPSRETDMSYLHNFVKFHDYKDILVESVPLDRWAVKAVEGTLPGIFAGLLLNYYDLKLQSRYGDAAPLTRMAGIRRAIERGWLDKEEVKGHLIRAYGCESPLTGPRRLGGQYRAYIERFVDQIFRKIVRFPWEDQGILDGFSILHCRIMTSMRDTDEQLIIKLK